MGEEVAPEIAQAVENGARQHHAEAMAEAGPEQGPQSVKQTGGDDRMQRQKIDEKGVECLLAEIGCALVGRRQQNAIDHDTADDDRRQNCGAGCQQHEQQRDEALPAIGPEPVHQAADKPEVESACLHLVIEYGVVAATVLGVRLRAHAVSPVRLPRLCASSSRRPCCRSSAA